MPPRPPPASQKKQFSILARIEKAASLRGLVILQSEMEPGGFSAEGRGLPNRVLIGGGGGGGEKFKIKMIESVKGSTERGRATRRAPDDSSRVPLQGAPDPAPPSLRP